MIEHVRGEVHENCAERAPESAHQCEEFAAKTDEVNDAERDRSEQEYAPEQWPAFERSGMPVKKLSAGLAQVMHAFQDDKCTAVR